MKLLVAIITVVFSLQAVLMSGAMAAGHMGDADISVSSLSQQDITEAKATDFAAGETKILSQNTDSNTSQNLFCCALDCSCIFFLGHKSPFNHDQKSEVKDTFYLIHLAAPAPFVLPDPPRTTQI